MSALLAPLLLSVGYIAPFYIWQTGLPRSHLRTVALRIFCVLGYCCVAWLVPLQRIGWQEAGSLAGRLGLRLDNLLLAMLLPLGLTACLFLGPLTLTLTDPSRWRQRSVRDITAWRDLMVAPVTEEFVFRACLLVTLLAEGLSDREAILVAPLYFGVAHMHHADEFVRHQGWSLRQAIAMVCFQFAYTTVFGWYAAFLFVRTGNLAAAVIPHAFCNVMGVPDFAATTKRPLSLAALVMGIAGFVFLLGPLTRPGLYHNV